MNDYNPKMLEAYYKSAESWNTDRLRALRMSRLVAWWAAATLALVAVAEAIALAALVPLKTVVPYTLLVDRTTGYVQPLKPLDPDRLSPDTALTQSFIVQYVLAREGFDVETIAADYRKVALLSGPRLRSAYIASMQATNLQSPLAAYPRGTTVDVRVKSISVVGHNVALVRFDSTKVSPDGHASPAQPWITVVHFEYTSLPLTLEDRFVNPLGFQVVDYRRSAEAPSPNPPATAHNALDISSMNPQSSSSYSSVPMPAGSGFAASSGKTSAGARAAAAMADQ